MWIIGPCGTVVRDLQVEEWLPLLCRFFLNYCSKKQKRKLYGLIYFRSENVAFIKLLSKEISEKILQPRLNFVSGNAMKKVWNVQFRFGRLRNCQQLSLFLDIFTINKWYVLECNLQLTFWCWHFRWKPISSKWTQIYLKHNGHVNLK